MKKFFKQGVSLVTLLLSLTAFAQVNVTTYHNDAKHSGQNLAETVLTTANVNTGSFGMLFKLAVDDKVFNQPLYVSGAINGKDVVYVGTGNNSVYAFDAKAGGAPLWQKNFNNGGRPPTNTDVGVGGDGYCGGGYFDFRGNIGIVGTPVIDATAKTIYFVTRTIEGGTHHTRLHALDITNGNERAGSPLEVNASLSGNGDGGSTINFHSMTDAQRASLTLVNGNVYIAFASYCDVSPYHGWVIGYNASTLAQIGKFAVTRDGKKGGIWNGGQGPTTDNSGNLYVATGNGDFNGTTNFGESIVKLNSTLGFVSSFTPSDWQNLNNGDTDVGSGGVMYLPTTGGNFVLQGGKDGQLHLMSTNNLGGVGGAVQQFQAVHQNCCSGHIHGSPIYWQSATNGTLVYVWGENDVLREFKFDPTTHFNTTAFKTSGMRAPMIGSGMSGGLLSVSSNGTGNGIVWANTVYDGDALHDLRPGILHAFDANDVSRELWNNHQITSDDCGTVSKYVPPTIANGRVYQSSFANGTNGDPNHGQVCVYGLRTAPNNGIVSGGVYTLVNQMSGKAMDNNGATTNGGAIVQFAKNNGANQNWTITDVGGGQYKIVSNSGLAMDNSSSAADGFAMVQWTYNGGPQQLWNIFSLGGGIYKVTSVQSGKTLDNGNVTTEGVQAPTMQWTDNGGGTTQKWQFILH